MSPRDLWARYRKLCCVCDSIGVTLDVSRMKFPEVLKARDGRPIPVETDVTSGDFLLGFLLGTRRALYEKDRESISLTVADVSARTVGTLIALYERAVGFYGSLVGINAYSQPGVEAGKKAAGAVIELQRRILACLRADKLRAATAEEVAEAIGASDEAETVFKVLEHLAVNAPGVRRIPAKTPWESRYQSS
jgi:glucose-6-phosphate isomerase